MPVKKSKRPVSPPSEDSGEEGDDQFLVDPEQIFDVLPQPFRLIDKTVNYIFDQVWAVIEEIEDDKALKLSKECLPSYDCGRPLFDLVQPSCICSDNTGKVLFVAHNEGISAVEALIGQSLATYEDSSARNIIKMNSCLFHEGFYVLATLDNAGVAKLFCYFGDQLQLAKVFTDESNKQAAVSLIQLSDDASYVGLGWEASGKESWLEVLRIPKDAWIKEAETSLQNLKLKKPVADLQEAGATDNSLPETTKPTEEQETGSINSEPSLSSSRPESSQGTHSQSSFTKPTPVLKVRPPTPVGPCAATNYATALKSIDAESNIFGIGNNHILMSPYFEHSDLTFKSLHQPLVKYLTDENQEQQISTPNFHFLKPGKFVPAGLDTAPNKTNSIAVWWSGGTQMFIYSLVKGSKDLEIKPEVVWPNAQQIHTSTVSDCLSVLALGMTDGTVIVWDVHRGILLRVCSITTKAIITCMHFLPSSMIQSYADDLPSYLSSPVAIANLAVACDDGSFNVIHCGVAYSPPVKPLVDKSAMQNDIITSICTLSKTPQVVAACKKSGHVTFYDITTYTAICHAALPQPHMVDTLSFPCIAADRQVLVLKGCCPDEDAEEDDAMTSTVFTFPLHSFPSLNRYWRMAAVSEPYHVDNTIETRMNSLVQDRLSSQGTRQIRMQDRWGKFKDELNKIQSDKNRINNSPWLTKQQEAVNARG